MESDVKRMKNKRKQLLVIIGEWLLGVTTGMAEARGTAHRATLISPR